MKEVKIELTEDDLRELLLRNKIYRQRHKNDSGKLWNSSLIDVTISLQDVNLDKLKDIVDEVKRYR